MKMPARLVWVLLLLLLSGAAMAQADLELLRVAPAEDGSQTWSLSLQVLVLMTLLTLLPSLLLMFTSFTRIVVVLAILRQAMGTGTTPSNQVLIGLALFLTLFVMTPVAMEVNEVALGPYMAQEISMNEAMQQGIEPIHRFMRYQVRESDLLMFAEVGGIESAIDEPADIPLRILIPAFITSELKTAFQIGFLIFIPFLIIDLAVASVLMSMGMMMLSPMLVSLPFKLMLFVLVDGWALIAETLVASFFSGG